MQNILEKIINANIEIEVWPYRDNAALTFTANLSKPSVSIVTPRGTDAWAESGLITDSHTQSV